MRNFFLPLLLLLWSSPLLAYNEIYSTWTSTFDKVGIEVASQDVDIALCANGSAPASGQILKYNGTIWDCATDSSGGGATVDISDDSVFVVSADTINFTTGLNASSSGSIAIVSGDMATTTTPGIASFDTASFTVGSFGGVSIKAGGVSLATQVTGVLPMANGGTALSTTSNDALLVGNNAGTGYDQPALPNCADSGGGHLNYTAATGNFTCGTSSSAAVAGSNTEVQFNNAGAFGASNRFKWDGAKAIVSGDGTGSLGSLYIQRGDVVNQYIVLHENHASQGSAFVTFKGGGVGNAIAMGALFSAGEPVGYTFTDPAGIEQVGINTTTGNLTVSSDIQVAGSSVCRANGTNCQSIVGNAGTIRVSEDGTFLVSADTVNFTTGLKATASGAKVTVSGDMATTTTPGIASFDTATFTVGSFGGVTVKAGGINAATQITGVLPITSLSQNVQANSINFIIDGGGSAITTGIKGFVEIPYGMDFVTWSALADQSGSIDIDVWKDSYANFPPTVADTITGTEKPYILSGVKSQDTALATWTKSVTSGDIIAINVVSASTVQRVTLSLWGRKTS